MTSVKPHVQISTTKYPITSKPDITEPTISSTTPSTQAFLKRNNLTPTDLLELYQFFIYAHPHSTYTPVPSQGFCSLTFSLSSNLIIQFRTKNYILDLTVTSLATKIYPTYAPTTRYVTTLPRTGLLVYEMSIMPGTSLQDCRVSNPDKSTSPAFLENLITSFAAFQVESYKSSSQPPPSNYKNTKVASTLHPRLLSLHKDLPPRFETLTARLLKNFGEITSLPWVLTHGDLLPGNIMVSSKHNSGQLTGFVDWGESEYLPFGMGFYGVDEILKLPSLGASVGKVRFHPDSEKLRNLFWEELERGGVPGSLRGRMAMARELGILLWFGIAWDGGRIDRVVEEGRDDEEIGKLDGFLFGYGEGDFEAEKGEVEKEGIAEIGSFQDNEQESKAEESSGVLREKGITFEAKL